MAAQYPYAQKKLWDEPFHYMYTPYGGVEFLRAYLANRQKLCATLGQARRQSSVDSFAVTLADELHHAFENQLAGNGSRVLRERALKVLPTQPGQSDFDTEDVLLDLLQVRLYAPERAAECLTWETQFIRKFEVSKRLYRAYTASFKAVHKEADRLENYALMAVLLAWLYNHSGNLKYLNSIFKLVDLLASAENLGERLLAQMLLLIAVEQELSAVAKLLELHRVEV